MTTTISQLAQFERESAHHWFQISERIKRDHPAESRFALDMSIRAHNQAVELEEGGRRF